tara:strand:+ start:1373 stop:3157 length:1785 start_codon:yes stop_codon:yes gene_type:complete
MATSISKSVNYKQAAAAPDYQVAARPVDTFIQGERNTKGMQVAAALEQASGAVARYGQVQAKKANEAEEKLIKQQSHDLSVKMEIAENSFTADQANNPEKYRVDVDGNYISEQQTQDYRDDFYADVDEYALSLHPDVQQSYANLTQTAQASLSGLWQKQNTANRKEDSFSDLVTAFNTGEDKSLSNLETKINNFSARWNMDRGDVNRLIMKAAKQSLEMDDPSLYNALIDMKQSGVDVFKVQKNATEASDLTSGYRAYENRLKAKEVSEAKAQLKAAQDNIVIRAAKDLMTGSLEYDDFISADYSAVGFTAEQMKTRVKQQLLIQTRQALEGVAEEDRPFVLAKLTDNWARTGLVNEQWKAKLSRVDALSGDFDIENEKDVKELTEAYELYQNLRVNAPRAVSSYVDEGQEQKFNHLRILSGIVGFEQAVLMTNKPFTGIKGDKDDADFRAELNSRLSFGTPLGMEVPIAKARDEFNLLMSYSVPEDEAFDHISNELNSKYMEINTKGDNALIETDIAHQAFPNIDKTEYLGDFIMELAEHLDVDHIRLERQGTSNRYQVVGDGIFYSSKSLTPEDFKRFVNQKALEAQEEQNR